MKYYKSLSTVFLILLLLFSMTLTSCSLLLADRETFDGGEILDNEKMSEIRSKVFATEPIETEADESGERNSNASDAGQPKETDKIDEHPTTETEVASPSEKGSEAIETDHLIDTQDVVYWTQNGEVWHTKKDCRYLKNKDILSGTQEDALGAGKSRLCSSCEK